MKRKKKIVIAIAVALVTLLVVFPAAVFGYLNWKVFPPGKLTPLVVNEVNKMINGRLACERIELTFFETYPHLGIRFTNGQLISHAIQDSLHSGHEAHSGADSLLCFTQATVSLRPLDYLFKGIVTIGEIVVENPFLYGFVDDGGVANWDIFVSGKDSTAVGDSSSALPPIDLQKVRIVDGRFIYDDHQTGLYAEVGGFFFQLSGSLTTEGNTLDIETGSSSILFRSQAYTLNNKLALRLKSRIVLTDGFNTVTLQGAELMVNDLPFTADGAMTNLPERRSLGVNLEMGLKASDMNELLGFIPDAYLKDREKMVAAGSVTMEGNIYGEIDGSVVPTVDLCLKIAGGSFFMKGVKQGIEALEMDMDLHLDGAVPELSYITLEDLTLKGLNTSLDVKGTATGLMHSPAIDACMRGQIDFTRLAEEFLNPDTLLVRGKMDVDLDASFLLDDLIGGRYDRIKAYGKLDIDTLRAYSHPYEVDVFVANAHLAIDSVKATSAYIAGNDLLQATLTVDSVQVKYKGGIDTNISWLEASAKTSPVMDTTAVIPLTTHIRVKQLKTLLPDSVWLVAGNAYLRGGIKASASDKKTAVLLAGITIDSLRYFDFPSKMGLALTESTFSVETLPYREAMRQRAQAMHRDSAVTVAGRDTTGRRSRRTGGENMRAQEAAADSPGSFFRNREVRGSVSFHQARLFSRMFPLPMRMEKTKVTFDTNNIAFSDALFHAGKSDFRLNGEVSSIRRAMLRGGTLKGSFSIDSEFIDCDELARAVSRGMVYAGQQEQKREQEAMPEGDIVEMDIKALQDSIAVAVTDTAEVLFVVPSFLDMALNVNVKRIHYKDLELEDVAGEVALRNRSLNLRKLAMGSNIGRGNLTMFYTGREQGGATVGFDLDVQEILVEKLIALYPSIDTLLPMLRSFEGVVDCQMAATCDMDSVASLLLPSLNLASHLHGRNMVLLDGETFAEISKTLMFKNKKRNLIDSISVDLAIRESKIEIFPFLVEMDRYRVAVGGTHNLDMTFDYHVSVLKSPVPFKLGIDITGNPDKFKYKITKCRYKDIFQPAKEKELTDSKSNIRESIQAFIRKQIMENAGLVADHSEEEQ